MGSVVSRVFRRQPSLSVASTYAQLLEGIRQQVRQATTEKHTKQRRLDAFKKIFWKYSIALWTLLAVICYFWNPPAHHFVRHNALKISPLLILPLFLYLFYRLVTAFYTRSIQSLTELLEELDTLMKDKLDELMNRTNFHEIQRLIREYHGGTAEEEKRLEEEFKAKERAAQAAAENAQYLVRQNGASIDQASAFNRGEVTVVKPRGNLDKIVDYILGDGPNNRYALICRNCFTHNGLVTQQDLGICFRCVQCGFLNHPQQQDSATAPMSMPGSPPPNALSGGSPPPLPGSPPAQGGAASPASSSPPTVGLSGLLGSPPSARPIRSQSDASGAANDGSNVSPAPSPSGSGAGRQRRSLTEASPADSDHGAHSDASASSVSSPQSGLHQRTVATSARKLE